MHMTMWKGAAAVAIVALAGCGMMDHQPGGSRTVVTLTGANEVPAVDTTAVGTATITVNADHTVEVKVIVQGMTPTASHIHLGAAGTNGPVVVPFTKAADYEFIAPPGARLTDEQWSAYKNGSLYVNVHSAKHPGGEIRGQIKP
ncbi:MAG TPA: CHRD domain-containing protein [Usitatibacter sp.]|nr:CHRD domain-containing protein [Usitatibacter sp.]